MNLTIGLCGPSGSGKTTLAKMLAEEFVANIISLDNYFLLDPPYKKYDENGKNWELPENVDWAAINEVMESVHSKESVKIRKIDWDLNAYTEISIKPAPVTIIEGFLLLHDDKLVQWLDLGVYIDIPDQVGLSRRMKREGTEENKTWFEEVTFPEYVSRRDSFKQKADLVLNGEDNLESNFGAKGKIQGPKPQNQRLLKRWFCVYLTSCLENRLDVRIVCPCGPKRKESKIGSKGTSAMIAKGSFGVNEILRE